MDCSPNLTFLSEQNSLQSSKWGKKLILIVFMGQKKGIRSDYGVKNTIDLYNST